MDSVIKTRLTPALLALTLGAALATPAEAGIAKGEFLVSVTVVNSCRVGNASDSRLSQYTGFSLTCSRGTDYTVQVANAAERSLDTHVPGVTSVTVRY